MRVYLPATGADLRALASGGQLARPRHAYAVTAELRGSDPDADEEELEYAAMTTAAQDSLRLLAKSADPYRRRVVLAADVPDRDVRPSDDRAGVVVDGEVGLEQVAAIHVDGDDVTAALTAALAGDPGALDEHELLWYARQELADLLR